MFSYRLSFLCLLLSATVIAGPQEDISKQIITPEKRPLLRWRSDLEFAKKKAKDENKWILVALLGQEGCPWTEKLEKEYLGARQFTQKLSNQAELVSFSRQTSPEAFDLIAKEYKVEEIPLFVALEKNGKEMFRLGFLPIDPQEFSEKVLKLAKTYNELEDAEAKHIFSYCTEENLKEFFHKARQLGNAGFIDTILKIGMQKDQDGYFAFEKYRHLILEGLSSQVEARKLRKKIEAKDPKNEKGLQLKLALLDFESMQDDEKRNKMQTVLQPLFRYMHRFGKTDTENLWKIELMIAQFLYGKYRTSEALKHLEKSLQSAPEEQKEGIVSTIEYLKLQMTKTK